MIVVNVALKIVCLCLSLFLRFVQMVNCRSAKSSSAPLSFSLTDKRTNNPRTRDARRGGGNEEEEKRTEANGW